MSLWSLVKWASLLAVVPAIVSAFSQQGPGLANLRQIQRTPAAASWVVLHANNNNQKKKGFIDEILDGLDTMVGVSPLSEEDLKNDSANNSNNNDTNMDYLQKRMEERDKVAPPSDALQKPSVAIFFTILALVPILLSIAALRAGVRPFNL